MRNYMFCMEPTREELDSASYDNIPGKKFELTGEYRRVKQGEYYVDSCNGKLLICNQTFGIPNSCSVWILKLKEPSIYPCLKKYTFDNGRVWVVLCVSDIRGVLIYVSPYNVGMFDIGTDITYNNTEEYIMLPSNEQVILSN